MTLGKYLLPFITFPYLTRVLTPTYYGIVSYMTSMMVWIQAIIDFGYIYSATRESSIYRDNKKKLGEILSVTVVSRLALSVIAGIVLFVMTINVDILRENSVMTLLFFLSASITSFLPDYIYRGLEKMDVVSVRFITARLISTGLTFVLIHSPSDMYLVPVLAIAGNFGAILFSYWHLFRKERVFPTVIRFGNVVQSIKASSVYFVSTFAITAYGAITTFFMGYDKFPSEQIAFWNVSLQIIHVIIMFYDPIISSVYPNMVKEKNRQIIRKTLIVIMPIVIVGTVITYFLAKTAIMIVGGEQYLEAVPIFRRLLPMLVFSFPAQLFGFPALALFDKEKMASLSSVMVAIIHITVVLALEISGHLSLLTISIAYVSTSFLFCSFRLFIFYSVASRSNKGLFKTP